MKFKIIFRNKSAFTFYVCILLLISNSTFSQSLLFSSNETNVYLQKEKVDLKLDSLRSIIGDSAFFSEGSEFNQAKRFFDFWCPRLFPNGDFGSYDKAISDYYTNNSSGPNRNRSSILWKELGPTKKPEYCEPIPIDGCYASGTGPVEFISFFKNNPLYMLCGSAAGGIFYSTNGGNNWNVGGSDNKFPRSSCVDANFSNNDYKTWYAISNYNNSNTRVSIRYTGGVYRTTDEGSTWELIAGQNELNGTSTIVYKLLIDPMDENILYVATSDGLYKSTNVTNSLATTGSMPTFNKILTGWVYDLEMKPTDSQTLFATFKTTGWDIIKSIDGGNNWTSIPNQPIGTSTSTKLTLETSQANSNILYCFGVGGGKVYIFNLTNLQCTLVGNVSNTHGEGQSFAVNQYDPNEIYVCNGIEGKRITISGSNIPLSSAASISGSYHVDIEFIKCHPLNANEVWIACDGGVYKSDDNGITWQDRTDGIGVAMTYRLAASYTDPEYVLIGCYHAGSSLTSSPYQDPWNPEWTTVTNYDGQRTLIDNTSPKNMWASGQYGNWFFSDNYGNISSWQAANTNSIGWFTEGVLNKVTPSILYRVNQSYFGTPPKIIQEVMRSNDNATTNEVISSFHTNPLFPPGNYLVWEIFTIENNKDYLLVHIIVDHSTPNQKDYLLRSKNVNDIASNVQWENLPLPHSGWMSEIKFSEHNPDLIYLAQGSSSSWTNSLTGSNMVYLMDYASSNLPNMTNWTCNIGCTDLTENLPNVGVGLDALAVEKGSNGGIYVGTDVGVFYTNNKFLSDGTGWQQHGSNLPNVPVNSLEINYVTNKIRTGLNGRGVWEANLYCPPSGDLTITSTTSPTEFDETKDNIFASANNFVATDRVSYRAGNQIHLTDGFRTNGAYVHAFIHPCDAPGNSFKSVSTTSHASRIEENEKQKIKNTGNLIISPNPNNGTFKISLTKEDKPIGVKELKVFDLMGNVIWQTGASSNTIFDVDISKYAQGIYYVRSINDDGEIEVKKLVKQ